MADDRFETLISAEQIAARITELGKELDEIYGDEPVLALGVLKGSILFMSDLIRAMESDVRCAFLGVSSYHGTTSTGEVRITHDLTASIEGQNVLIVEDIVDTGLTLSHLLDLFKTRKPASVKVCSLLHKPARTRIEVPVDYLGFTIEDKFVVGYGLDWAQRYRNLPFVGVVSHSED